MVSAVGRSSDVYWANCRVNSLDALHRTVLPALHVQAANSQGIQTLLEAEKEAAKVVQKARQCECSFLTVACLPAVAVADVAPLQTESRS